MYNTILLRDHSKVFVDHQAYEALRPGMLVELTSTNRLKKHATSGGNIVVPTIVLEDEWQGKGIEDAYVTGDQVRAWVPGRGDEALLLLADGENVAIGDALESNGLGMVKKHTIEAVGSADAQQANTIYSRPIIGIALEAQDLSALDGSNSSLESNSQFIKVRIA